MLITPINTMTSITLANNADYFCNLENEIKHIYGRPSNNEITYDILDTEKSKQYKLIALKEKQRVMKVGEIWQLALGTYHGNIDLKQGHPSGLDILSDTKKIAIELKNRTNTDNASSRKSNLDKLSKFKHEHPDYMCIYANINAKDEQKTMTHSYQIIIHNGVEIHHYVGYEFLKFMLGNDTDEIIEFIKDSIDNAF